MHLFRVGLDKLEHTEIEVKDMQEILIRMKPELDAAAEVTAIVIEEINQDTVSIMFDKLHNLYRL